MFTGPPIGGFGRQSHPLSCRLCPSFQQPDIVTFDNGCTKARSDKPNSTTARKAMNGMWSTPHNWCDRRCDRCRLALDCEVNLACIRRRAEHEVRGEDPDSPETMAEDLQHTLESAVHMVEQLAREAEIDLSEPLPLPPVAGGAVCVQRAGEQVLRALAKLQAPLAGASEAQADAAEETIAQWSLLVAKAARIFSYTLEFDPDTWAQDAEPNLLLMHMFGAAPRACSRSCSASCEKADSLTMCATVWTRSTAYSPLCLTL